MRLNYKISGNSLNLSFNPLAIVAWATNILLIYVCGQIVLKYIQLILLSNFSENIDILVNSESRLVCLVAYQNIVMHLPEKEQRWQQDPADSQRSPFYSHV